MGDMLKFAICIAKKIPHGENMSSRDNNDQLLLLPYFRAQSNLRWEPAAHTCSTSTAEGGADSLELVDKRSKQKFISVITHTVFSQAIFFSIVRGAHVVSKLLLL